MTNVAVGDQQRHRRIGERHQRASAVSTVDQQRPGLVTQHRDQLVHDSARAPARSRARPAGTGAPSRRAASGCAQRGLQQRRDRDLERRAARQPTAQRHVRDHERVSAPAGPSRARRSRQRHRAHSLPSAARPARASRRAGCRPTRPSPRCGGAGAAPRRAGAGAAAITVWRSIAIGSTRPPL